MQLLYALNTPLLSLPPDLPSSLRLIAVTADPSLIAPLHWAPCLAGFVPLELYKKAPSPHERYYAELSLTAGIQFYIFFILLFYTQIFVIAYFI